MRTALIDRLARLEIEHADKTASQFDREAIGALLQDLAVHVGGYAPGRGKAFSDGVAHALGYPDGEILRAHMRDPENDEWRRRLTDAVVILKTIKGATPDLSLN